MLDSESVRELTNEQLQEYRDRAMKTLIQNQECYVAQWILQNPFANMNDYMLKFYPEEGNPNVYGVRMEKVEK